jgi:dTDP-4-amino-4,6-dideoxygalactose transaminase
MRLNFMLFGRQGRASISEILTGIYVILRQRYSIVEGNSENFVSPREKKFANLLGYDFAIACGSGGVAIQLSLRALNLNYGDKVAVQHNTCVATAQAILAADLVPIFIKTLPGTFLLDKEDLRKQVQGHNVKTIIATHLSGGIEDIENLIKIGNELGVPLIEDACLSLVPSRVKKCFAKIEIISFGFSKPISVGEGAVIFTNDKLLATELRALRHWGTDPNSNSVVDLVKASWNGRITYLQLAIASSKINQYKLKRRLLMRRIKAINILTKKLGVPFSLYTGAAEEITQCGFNSIVFKFDKGLSQAERLRILNALRSHKFRFKTTFFPSIPTFPIFQEIDSLARLVPLDVYKSNYHRIYQDKTTIDLVEFFSLEEKDLIAVYVYLKLAILIFSFRTVPIFDKRN